MNRLRKLVSLSELQQLLPTSSRPEVLPPKHEHDGKRNTVRVFLETKGRKGKSVTIVSGLQHNPDTMEEIARILKQYCGAGGTVKNRNVEIQGDQRERAIEKLQQLNYVVK